MGKQYESRQLNSWSKNLTLVNLIYKTHSQSFADSSIFGHFNQKPRKFDQPRFEANSCLSRTSISSSFLLVEFWLGPQAPKRVTDFQLLRMDINWLNVASPFL